MSVAGMEQVCRQWQERFSAYWGRDFVLRFTDNSSTMISYRKRKGVMELRLHNMFIEADDRVLAALGAYLKGSRRGNRRLDLFIQANADKIGRRRRKSKLNSKGQYYQLENIRDALNQTYFKEPVEVPVIWGRATNKRRRSSIRLGTYSFADQLIRIHPALDDDRVPAYVVAAVVFHEMLHHVVGATRKGTRRMVHTREFKERERAYLYLDKALVWQEKNLGQLLRSPKRRSV